MSESPPSIVVQYREVGGTSGTVVLGTANLVVTLSS